MVNKWSVPENLDWFRGMTVYRGAIYYMITACVYMREGTYSFTVKPL